jgi:hypothetical protein
MLPHWGAQVTNKFLEQQVDALGDVRNFSTYIKLEKNSEGNDIVALIIEEIVNNIRAIMVNFVIDAKVDFLLVVDGAIAMIANKNYAELERMRRTPNFHELLCENAYAKSNRKLKSYKRAVTKNDAEICLFLSGFIGPRDVLQSFGERFYDERVRLLLEHKECKKSDFENALEVSNMLMQEILRGEGFVGRDDAFLLNNSINAYVAWLYIFEEEAETTSTLMTSLRNVLGIFDWIWEPRNHNVFLNRYKRFGYWTTVLASPEPGD